MADQHQKWRNKGTSSVRGCEFFPVVSSVLLVADHWSHLSDLHTWPLSIHYTSSTSDWAYSFCCRASLSPDNTLYTFKWHLNALLLAGDSPPPCRKSNYLTTCNLHFGSTLILMVVTSNLPALLHSSLSWDLIWIPTIERCWLFYFNIINKIAESAMWWEWNIL